MTLTLAQARTILDNTLAAAREKKLKPLGIAGVERPHMAAALIEMSGGTLVPVPGGVLIRDKADALLGAVGVSGDTSDNDEAAAIAGIEAAGFVAETGG